MNPQYKKNQRAGQLLMLAALAVGLLPLAPITASAQTQGTAQGSASNPFTEGTKRVVLTAEEKKSLAEYAENSKARLDKAKAKAQGKNFAERNAIYKKAIIEVVLKSYAGKDSDEKYRSDEKHRSELLMRYALNEALELAMGTPGADGRSIAAPAVLQNISNQDLLTKILEQSIDLAISYYQDERKAIATGSLINLPYLSFAVKHLALARTWQASVFESKYLYEFQIKSLEHFMSAAGNAETQSRANFAEELTAVDEALTEYQAAPTTQQEMLARTRKLRRLTRETVEKVGEKVEKMELEAINAAKLTEAPAVPGVPGPYGMKFQFIHAKNVRFTMGSLFNERDRDQNEDPHLVTFTHDFEMQTTAVTQAQYLKVMGNNPSYFKNQGSCPGTYKADDGGICPNNPVDHVSWDDTQTFIHKLNTQAPQGCKFRLPTEAEWEYSARAGTTTAYYFGNDANELEDQAWYKKNSDQHTHEVAQKGANAFGLYDMVGNVWQWVSDWYQGYPTSAVIDPTGPESGFDRVIRGGGFATAPQGLLRSAQRGNDSPGNRSDILGFRLVRICR